MRAMFSILLIALLVFQIGGLVAAMPCHAAGMEMDACNGAAEPRGEDACLATGCCCTLCPGVEPPEEYETIAIVESFHTTFVCTARSTTEKASFFCASIASKPLFPIRDTGSSPALYLLNHSYLI